MSLHCSICNHLVNDYTTHRHSTEHKVNLIKAQTQADKEKQEMVTNGRTISQPH